MVSSRPSHWRAVMARLADPDSVAVGDGGGIGVFVRCGVAEGRGVFLGMGVAVFVAVREEVAIGVAVEEGVAVGVAVGGTIRQTIGK